jgi:hypothetical protein
MALMLVVGLFLFACSKEKEELASREKGLDTALVRDIAKDGTTERPVKIKVDSVLSK